MRLAMIGLLLLGPAAAGVADDVVSLARSSGVEGGLVVHVGCGDGRVTAQLRLDDRFQVHGLDRDPAQVQAARRYLLDRDLYGPVTVARFDGQHLPYADNLVNLLVDSTGTLSHQEILRVLVPGGAAIVNGKKIVKPWPENIDEWTHFLHGPDNNAVARDRRVGIPRSMQWVCEPRWGRSHEQLTSFSTAVSAGGRLFYIVDEAPLASIRFPGDWKLVARDAFNGQLLWKRSLSGWVDPLRHFRSGPAHLPRRLVAAGQRVYATLGLAEPVSALDAATGRTLQVYQGTERTEEILFDRGVLYLVVGSSEVRRVGEGLFHRGEPPPTRFRFIAAVQADSGKMLWRKDFPSDEFLLPLTLAVNGNHVYYQSTFGVGCLDASTGDVVWRTPRPTPAQRMAFSAPTLVATEKVVLDADRDLGKGEEGKPARGPILWGVHGWNQPGFSRRVRCTLKAYAAEDGRLLWEAPCQEGYNSPVDIFVVGDTVWVGTSLVGLDLYTGQVKREVNTKGPRVGMSHHRCYRNKASERFIFTGKSGIEVISLTKGWLSNNSWVRGACQYGIMPANGLLYAPPDACACFLTVKAPGLIALAPERPPAVTVSDEDRLQPGPAAGAGAEEAPASAGDWPMYRHDSLRSGVAGSPLPAAPRRLWAARIGGRLTQPTIAAGKVFVARSDTHTVHALDAASGRPLWQFTAGGRIDSPPTYWRGRVLFGAADGWVYCLRAADGQLMWRFLAAPAERLVTAYGQLESSWPVHGAVLLQNETLYVAAGRSSYMDGGITLWRLDPLSGKPLSRTVLYHLDPKTGQQLVSEARFNMEGTTNDVLTGDGQRVYLKYFAFDKSGRRTSEDQPHLFSITSLLGEEWFVRSYWVLGKGMPGAGWGGWADAAHQFPFGRILCFTDSDVFGYGRKELQAGPVGHQADEYHLFRASRAASAQPEPAQQAKQARQRRRGQQAKRPAPPAPLWSQQSSLIVRAMVLGPERLAIAGPVSLGKKDPEILAFQNEQEALAAFEGKREIYLRVVQAEDGKPLEQLLLPSLPVFDGMAAADGKLFLSLRNGQLLCLGE